MLPARWIQVAKASLPRGARRTPVHCVLDACVRGTSLKLGAVWPSVPTACCGVFFKQIFLIVSSRKTTTDIKQQPRKRTVYDAGRGTYICMDSGGQMTHTQIYWAYQYLCRYRSVTRFLPSPRLCPPCLQTCFQPSTYYEPNNKKAQGFGCHPRAQIRINHVHEPRGVACGARRFTTNTA